MDIYFNPEYAKLNEYIEGGSAETFEFECEYGKVCSIYIKRSVPYLIDGEQYYDAITPYGYGGPVVVEASDREKLLAAYAEAYRKHCADEKIVDEFVRFHPLAENAKDFGRIYETIFSRNTLAIDTADPEFQMTQFVSTCRNKIRKAVKRGVTVDVDTECREFDDFIEIYYKTMNKNDATDYYYFEKPYFEQMRDIPGYDLIMINARLEGKLIGSALFMCSDKNMHYHLSATDPEYYSYAANNLILSTAAEYGHAHGFEWLHMGGGLSSSHEDPLFQFKRSFGRTDRNLKEFYIGKAIFMPEIYEKLCEEALKNGIEAGSFFPEYRAAH